MDSQSWVSSLVESTLNCALRSLSKHARDPAHGECVSCFIGKQAAAILRKTKSPQLSMLATSVELDAFTKVKETRKNVFRPWISEDREDREEDSGDPP